MHLLSHLMKGKYVALKRTDEDVSKSGRNWLGTGSHTPASQQTTWMNELSYLVDVSHNSIILLWVYWFSCTRTKMATVLRRWLVGVKRPFQPKIRLHQRWSPHKICT